MKEHSSVQRVMVLGVAGAITCACVFGGAGVLIARSARGAPLFALIAVAALVAWLLLLHRTIGRAFAPFTAIRSQLSKMLEAGQLRPLGVNDGTDTTDLTVSINRLIDTAGAAQESGAEFEFANKVFLREKERLRNALDSVGVGVLVIGHDKRLIFANRASEQFLSVAANEAPGKSLEEAVNDPRLLSFLAETDDNAQGVNDKMELSLDGQPSDSVFCVTANAVAGGDGAIGGKCVLFQDVTSVKRAETAREEFVNSVAHELRTPLTSIKAYAEMLIDGEAGDEGTRREFFNIIYEETNRLNRLIDNLLNISKMELGTVVINRTPTRLKKLIEDSAAVVEAQAAKKKMQLLVELPDRLPAVDVDKDLMNVVLVNLLGNAVKYTPESGRVSVSSTSTSEGILVHVSDTGVGIGEEDMPRVFDKFYRGSGKLNAEVTGSGLGLCIARQITRLHGGDITVSSRVGEGSQFTVTIPRDAIVTALGDYEHDRT